MLDAHRIFQLARSFEDAAKLLATDSNPKSIGAVSSMAVAATSAHRTIPSLVNAAFSLELYLKCLRCIETGNVVRGHNLTELFEALTAPTRQAVMAAYVRRCGVTSTVDGRDYLIGFSGALANSTIEELLDGTADTFQKLRYAFEMPPGAMVGSVGAVTAVEAIKDVIFSMRPTWTQ
jgi:hypothetical protein